MESRARIKLITSTIGGGADVVIHIDTPQLDDLIDKELRISLTRYRNKRSKDANAYFYVLVGKLADVMKVSKAYIHNLMLRKYGQIQTLDDRPVWVILPDTDEVAQEIDENDSVHLRPTSETKTGKDGRVYRTYLMLKGSHELDTKDMSTLIDGVVSECKEAGINTLTPAEIHELMERWNIEQHHTDG